MATDTDNANGKSVGVGDRVPDFALPNASGDTVAASLAIPEGIKPATLTSAYRETIPANKLGGHAVTLALAKR